jgi:group I intron endonuclease
MVKQSGIYKILNTKTGRIYIGSAIDLQLREKQHFNNLSKNKHCNLLLQASFNKHGKGAFVFYIIELVGDKNKLIEREQYYLDLYQSYKKESGYNICVTAGSQLGMKSKCKGVLRPEFAKTITGANNPFFGKTHTAENIKNQSEKQKGERNHFYGKTHSEEFRKKSSLIHKGKVFSPELRAKLSAAAKGRKKSHEHIAKIVASRLRTLASRKTSTVEI